jgi:hypothetical protein
MVTTQPIGFKRKTRKGIMGVNFTPMAIGIFFIIGTIIAISATTYFSGLIKTNKISLIETEVQEIYHSAIAYSATATATGNGFLGITAGTMTPYLTIAMTQGGDVPTVGDAGYLCSATSFGCQVKYYIAPDAIISGITPSTFHIYVDASAALAATDDGNNKWKFETAVQKGMTRLVSGAKIAATSAALTATNTTPAASAFTATAAGADGKFEIFNLN